MNATKQAAYDLAMSTDKAWHASLVQAFGKTACNRRYDMDKSGHPAECMRLHALRRAAVDAWHAMMMMAGPNVLTRIRHDTFQGRA